MNITWCTWIHVTGYKACCFRVYLQFSCFMSDTWLQQINWTVTARDTFSLFEYFLASASAEVKMIIYAYGYGYAYGIIYVHSHCLYRYNYFTCLQYAVHLIWLVRRFNSALSHDVYILNYLQAALQCTDFQHSPPHNPNFSCDLSKFSMKSPRYLLTSSVTRDSKTILHNCGDQSRCWSIRDDTIQQMF